MISSKRIIESGSFSTASVKNSNDFKSLFLITCLHIPLGVVIYNVGSLAILHPISVFLLGIYWASKKAIKLERLALVMAYLISSEVLWRMAQIPVFWEFGKYGTATIAIVALVTRRRFSFPNLPVTYFGLLLPACVFSFIEFDLAKAREAISFNLSGPFLLTICCIFFSNVRTNPEVLRRMLLALILPLVSVACTTLFYTVTIEDIQFTTESNFATSGGFGPNQVSSMLGLGAFIAFLCLIVFRNGRKEKLYFFAVAIFFVSQSVLTFSRGGIYNAVGAILVVSLLEIRNPAKAARRLAPLVGIAIVFLFLIFPILNGFTGGALQDRFEETETTHRSEIIESDFEILSENPVFGVGVGMAYSYREKFLEYKAASHTEFSRLFSEHGLFGIAAILTLVSMTILNVKCQKSQLGRALVLGSAVWSVLFMFNAGMRLAAPSFMWGLMFVTITAARGSQGRRNSGTAIRRLPLFS